ncbi:hypothetical protein EEB11_18625 [Pseudotabrizicola sediminis]|uniref:Uncharacterized protein n=1 Tax=Pseudotabrizicola sediminis TaxID=2486418 RepID=A0ABY2KGX7_9RHOB|nr:hypothetical protein [Pseudotabrizicola sediminis]TGD41444.1 hypothetical protein EEB11_18625 [Pseudotabrizicola sediminis]
MYIRPTPGNPLYYQYGALRTWAASKLGMAFLFEDQCTDFFHRNLRPVLEAADADVARIEIFEMLFCADRETMRKGSPPCFFTSGAIHELDVSYSRQPKVAREKELRSMFSDLPAEE